MAARRRRDRTPALAALPDHAVSFAPLTAGRFADLEALFGPRGACGGCWCMWWQRTRREFERDKGADNHEALQARVRNGAHPGLLAYVDGQPVGWCAVEPRENLPGLARSRILAPVDDRPAWSVSCFFVARDWRRRGLTVLLLRAAAQYATRSGAAVLEGYPKDPASDELADAFAWNGLAAAFRAAGFREVARRAPTRPIMRLELAPAAAGRPGTRRPGAAG